MNDYVTCHIASDAILGSKCTQNAWPHWRSLERSPRPLAVWGGQFAAGKGRGRERTGKWTLATLRTDRRPWSPPTQHRLSGRSLATDWDGHLQVSHWKLHQCQKCTVTSGGGTQWSTAEGMSVCRGAKGVGSPPPPRKIWHIAAFSSLLLSLEYIYLFW